MKQKLFFIATLFMIVACSYHDIEDVKSKNEMPNSISKEEARQN